MLPSTNKNNSQPQLTLKLAVDNKRVLLFFFSRGKHEALIYKQIPLVVFGIEKYKRKNELTVPMVENSYPMADNLENLQMASVKIVIQSFSVGIEIS